MSRLSHRDTSSLLGCTAAVAYTKVLLDHPETERFTVFNYASPPRLQQRITLTEAEQRIIDGALALRETARIAFWEAVFAHCALTETCTEPLLSAAFFHHGQGTGQEYTRSDLESNTLERITERNQTNVALGSRVLSRDQVEWHLGLLDFRCEISAGNTRVVHMICRKLMPSGFLVLDSGDSYHACTLNLLSPVERVHMLARALLASPIVDAPYIAHQLQQDSSSIRISKGGNARKVPVVIDSWGGEAR